MADYTKVKLTYFKAGGKYYSEASYYSAFDYLHDIWDEVEELRDWGKLPGLASGGEKSWHILVECPGHPNDHPRLIVGEAESEQSSSMDAPQQARIILPGACCDTRGDL